MPKPRIGVTCSPLRGPAYYAPYLRAVEAAGGEAVTLSPAPEGLPPAVARALLGGIAGLLGTGGGEVDAPADGEDRQEETHNGDATREMNGSAEERAAGAALQVQGKSDCGHFVSGFQFTLANHFDADGKYVLTRVEPHASLEAT